MLSLFSFARSAPGELLDTQLILWYNERWGQLTGAGFYAQGVNAAHMLDNLRWARSLQEKAKGQLFDKTLKQTLEGKA